MRCVYGTTYGASNQTLLIMYKALIRSILDYGAIAYDSDSTSTKEKLATTRRPPSWMTAGRTTKSTQLIANHFALWSRPSLSPSASTTFQTRRRHQKRLRPGSHRLTKRRGSILSLHTSELLITSHRCGNSNETTTIQGGSTTPCNRSSATN